MIDGTIVVNLERARDDLVALKTEMRQKYLKPSRQVIDATLRKRAAAIAEFWMVKVAVNQSVASVLGNERTADYTVHFQRLLNLSEHSSARSRYDSVFKDILRSYNLDVLIPLKQAQAQPAVVNVAVEAVAGQIAPEIFEAIVIDAFSPNAFVGHSFLDPDKLVVQCVLDTIASLGIAYVTGEKPKANRISEKVKRLIENQHLFVGVFTKRDKIDAKDEWTTSTWVIEEKAYALAKGKKLVLLKEKGVGTIGGIHGDYEFIEFSRDSLHELPIKIVQLFDIALKGLQG